ncbi:helix-turn-helix transcriptional regulator [Mycobacterium sp. OAS707]|uniref:helix-turn-helix transcriptional regulator n=1 Tax=Mycobacterium sp. OAS707 TaxID=2663822 RepID=UPI001788E927
MLRAALHYIDDNLHNKIALTDIAAATYVTPRTLQNLFRQHLNTTPMTYVRRVKLERAHCELSSSNRHQTCVSSIAERWGFTHPGRFASLYRQTYGHNPDETLRSAPFSTSGRDPTDPPTKCLAEIRSSSSSAHNPRPEPTTTPRTAVWNGNWRPLQAVHNRRTTTDRPLQARR